MNAQIDEPERNELLKSDYLEMLIDSLQIYEGAGDTANVIRFGAVITTNLHGSKAREQAKFYVDLAYRYAKSYSKRNFVPDISNRYGMLYFAFAKHYQHTDWNQSQRYLDSAIYWHGRAVKEGNQVTQGWGHRGLLSSYKRKMEFGLGDFSAEISHHYKQILEILKVIEEPQLFDHASGLYTDYLINTGRLDEAADLIAKIEENAHHTDLRNEFSYYKNIHNYLSKQHDLDTLIALSELMMDFYERRIIAAHENSFHEMDQRYKVSKTNEVLSITSNMLRESKTTVGLLILMLTAAAGVLIYLFILYRKNRILSKRNELLLKEQNHRVKNNLQMISSLLSLQSQKLLSVDAKDALNNSQLRVNSVALLHRMLYEGEHFGEVNLKEYIGSLVEEIRFSVHRVIQAELDIDEKLSLKVEQSTSLGLIINELITNSAKHIPAEVEVKIQLTIKKEVGKIGLKYADNGPGVDPEVWKRSASFGNQLIRIQSEQLRGDYGISRPGFIYSLKISA
ncbi:MAG: sensor histidine kinase [Marinoscillum sp.]